MNKFSIISAEACLKMDYFGSKSQKSPSTRASPPDTLVSVAGWFASRLLFRLNDKRTCKTLLPLNISGWYRCLAISEFWAKKNLYFIFSTHPLPKNVSAPLLSSHWFCVYTCVYYTAFSNNPQQI